MPKRTAKNETDLERRGNVSDNLIPQSERTKDEQREIARKGGIASGKARKQKKAMKDTLAILLTMPMKAEELTDIESVQGVAELTGLNVTVQEAIMLAQIKKAVKGDTRAAEFIRDSSGNMLNAESEARIEKLKAETERLKGGEDPLENKIGKLFDMIGGALDAD